MRTTVDLPDELFRQAKAHAALEGQSLKDLVTRGLQLVLKAQKGTSGKAEEAEGSSSRPIPPAVVLRKRASAGAWARQFSGIAKPSDGESLDDARMAHYREKYGVE